MLEFNKQQLEEIAQIEAVSQTSYEHAQKRLTNRMLSGPVNNQESYFLAAMRGHAADMAAKKEPKTGRRDSGPVTAQRTRAEEREYYEDDHWNAKAREFIQKQRRERAEHNGQPQQESLAHVRYTPPYPQKIDELIIDLDKFRKNIRQFLTKEHPAKEQMLSLGMRAVKNLEAEIASRLDKGEEPNELFTPPKEQVPFVEATNIQEPAQVIDSASTYEHPVSYGDLEEIYD